MSTESLELPEYADLPPEIEPHVRYAHGALDRLKFATTSDARIFDIHQAREGINALLRYALAHSRAQDSGGEVVCHECRLSLTGMCHKCAAEMDREMYDDFAAEQPAKGDVPLCEKYGDGCNFPDCPCDVDDPLTQQPFKGEKWRCACGDLNYPNETCAMCNQSAPQPSGPADAVLAQARREFRDSDAAGDVLDWLEERLATPPTAQRHDEGDESVWMFKNSLGGWSAFHSEKHRLDTIESGEWDVREFVPKTAAHGTNCQSAKADGGAVAPAAVEAVGTLVVWDEREGMLNAQVQNLRYDHLRPGNYPIYTAQQRSEQVAVSAAVVARALVECPISLVAESRWEWIAKYINTALSKQVAGGGGVDIRKATSGIFKVLAELLHGGQTDSEFEQDVIQRPYVLDRVVAIRQHVDEIWAAISTKPLLSDQAGGSETEETDNG